MSQIKMVAPCLFGTEGVLADELRRMGVTEVEAQNGRVLFSGTANTLAKVNINSRFCERVLINLGEFKANTFTELFEGVKALPWEDFIAREDSFPVNGWSLNSQLFSIPDCQAIIKKAIVERLKSKYNVSWFKETGAENKVRFSIMKNAVMMMIDTSGDGLHKRGYRQNSNVAPIKETLAATMCDINRIYPDTILHDPFCGSGTILIEAALMATRTAPGLNRYFVAEKFGWIDSKVWQEERLAAMEKINRNADFHAYGFDIDPAAVELTIQNAKKAGVDKFITAKVGDIKDFSIGEGKTSLITNPPYGERLLDIKSAEQLYTVMGQKFIPDNQKKYSIISPDDDFEKFYGRTADKRRKLYNGMIKCQMFMYFKAGN